MQRVSDILLWLLLCRRAWLWTCIITFPAQQKWAGQPLWRSFQF